MDDGAMVEQAEHLDPGALAELRDVMEEDFPVLIRTFLQDSVSRIGHIQEALDAQESEAFSRACHTLKGSCINIGAPRLAEYCRQGEHMGRRGDLSAAVPLVETIREEFEAVSGLLEQL